MRGRRSTLADLLSIVLALASFVALWALLEGLDRV
jgi:hypothetical protein